MATIALYANKVNQMPELVQGIKSAVNDYRTELQMLQMKALSISSSICNLDDVIASIQSSTQTQDDKISSFDTLEQNTEEFIEMAVSVDSEVADVINQQRAEFYEEYAYLKPECEKNAWDKFCDGCKRVGEWCKEHWKVVATVFIVIAAVGIICAGIGGIIGAIAINVLIGTVIGGIIGGTLNLISGGSFWEGLEDGAFSGAIAGIISGSMSSIFSQMGKVAISFGQTILIGAVSGSGTSLICDLGNKFIKGDNISGANILINMVVSGIVGTIFSGVGYGISRLVGTLFRNVSWFAESKELFRIGRTGKPNYGRITSYTTKDPSGISLNFANTSGRSILRIEFDVLRHLHFHFPYTLPTKAHMPLAPLINSVISYILFDNMIRKNSK